MDYRGTRAAILTALIVGGAGRAQSAPEVIAFTHVNVVPMDRARILFDQTVIVKGQTIDSIGPAESTPVPEGARQIAGQTRRFLVPGLSDMHVHLYYDGDLVSYLASGVTTVRNMRGQPRHLAWRERVARGELPGPTVYSAGPTLGGPGDQFTVVRTRAEGERAVREQKKAGYDFIKVYDSLPADAYQGLLAAARHQQMRVAGHIPAAVGLLGALKAGQASIEHAEQFVYHYFGHDFDETRIPLVAVATKKAGAYVCPTMSIIENYVQQVEDKEKLFARPEIQYANPEVIAWWRSQKKETAEENKLIARFQRKLVKALQDAGVPLLAGTDTHAIGLVPGFSLHRELQSMKAAGLTSFEVLRAATRNAGEFLGGGFGVVAAGKRADLLLLEGNPLDDLENLNRRVGVMARGQWFAAEKAKQMMDGLATEYRGATENGAKRLSPDAGS